MKKTLAIILACLLCLSLLGGCAKNTDDGSTPVTPIAPDDADPVAPAEDPKDDEPAEPETPTETPAEPEPETGIDRPEFMEVTLMLEGAEEPDTWTLFVDPEGEYSYYYDADNFELASGSEDTLTALDNVCICVDILEGDAETNLNTAMQESFLAGGEVSDATLAGQPARLLYSAEGTTGDSNVYEFYFIDLPDGRCLCAGIEYFLEAAEGWGSRLRQMADTIEVNI